MRLAPVGVRLDSPRSTKDSSESANVPRLKCDGWLAFSTARLGWSQGSSLMEPGVSRYDGRGSRPAHSHFDWSLAFPDVEPIRTLTGACLGGTLWRPVRPRLQCSGDMETAAAMGAPQAPGMAVGSATSPRARAASPEPLRPRGGFGGYLHELRRERGLTIRHLAAAAGVHHTYVSKLERGDRQAPEEAVVEALAAALQATPAQLDQLRWRAGLTPRGDGVPGSGDPTLTLVAEALADPGTPEQQRDRLRQGLARVVEEWKGRDAESGTSGQAGFFGIQGGHGSAVPVNGTGTTPLFAGQGMPNAPLPPASPAAPVSSTLPGLVPEAPPDGRATMLAAMMGGWQTVEEASAELRVTAAYLISLVQSGHLKAWALPGAPAGSPVGLRLRREDVLALLQPVRL